MSTTVSYENRLESKETDNIKFTVISTGSKGNAVVINDILIDSGVPFNDLKGHLSSINKLIITHEHTDHLQPKTIQRINKDFPDIQIILDKKSFDVSGLEMNNSISIVETFIGVVELDSTGSSLHRLVAQYQPHGVTRTLTLSMAFSNALVFYATDVESLEPNDFNVEYDYIFIEMAYDERQLKALGYNIPKRAAVHMRQRLKSHLSSQKAMSFSESKAKRDGSTIVIPLHQTPKFHIKF